MIRSSGRPPGERFSATPAGRSGLDRRGINVLNPRSNPQPVAMNADAQKRAAAARAVEFVRPGMRLGLGTGSTAKHFVELIGERVRAGLDVIAVPTSQATRADAERCGIALTTLDETPELDLTVDGADEIAPELSLIKGGGGALLREKIVAVADARRGKQLHHVRAVGLHLPHVLANLPRIARGLPHPSPRRPYPRPARWN